MRNPHGTPADEEYQSQESVLEEKILSKEAEEEAIFTILAISGPHRIISGLGPYSPLSLSTS
jgi:hypothetical protein